MTLWIWKRDTHSSICRTSNNTGDGSVSQMGKLRSEALIHLDKCSQSISNTSEANNLLNITFKNRCFWGLWISIALIHACSKTLVTWIYNYWGFMFHACLKTLVTWVLHFTFHIYTSKPISLGLPCIHVCSKTLLFMNGQDIHFISIDIVLMVGLFVSGLPNTT